MLKCPIDYFMNNLIFNADKSCWAVFKLAGYDYDYLSNDGKIDILNRIVRIFVGIMSEAQIIVIPVEQNTEAHFKNLKKKVKEDNVLYPIAMSQAEKTESYLKGVNKLNGAINDYCTYLVIKLDQGGEYETVGKIQETLSYFLKDPLNAINVHMNLDTKDILQSKINAFKKMADDWLFSNKYKLRMEATDTKELQWLFRRLSYRGMNKEIALFYDNLYTKQWSPKAEEFTLNDETIIRPRGRDIVNLFSGSLKRGNRYIEVETNAGTSYQAFFVITNIPEASEFPGCEWIYSLQQNNAQAEVCIHIKSTEHRSGLRKLEIKKREIDSQLEHIKGARAKPPEDLLDAKYYGETMEKELKDTRSPLLQATVTICLSADSLEKLENRCTVVKEFYEDMNFIIERPLADQVKLYMQLIPSVGITIKDFVIPITPKTLASGIIGATHELGDSVGPYIGTTGKEKKQVFVEMAQACLNNKSAAATFFGNLGVGKSFNANLLLILNIIFGGYGLIFDPKGERSHWETDLKPLKGLITTVTLGTESIHKGKLDPYNMYKNNIPEANELAISVITELFRISPTSEEYTTLLVATEKIEEGETLPSMMKLVDILANFPEDDPLHKLAFSISRKLRLQENNGMASLLIGNGTEDAVSLDNRLNIIQIQNLKMPSQDTAKEEYTTEENLSIVIMMVLSQFAKQFALVKRPVFKTILFDESWMLGKTREGVKLYEFISRMGRSLFTGAIYNGHSVLDIPTEGIRNTITYKFCFQTTNSSEAKRMLEFLNLEITEENIDVLKSLGNGECLFQDLSGRVGKLKFDAVFQDIIDVFSTTPVTEEDQKANIFDEKIVKIPEGDLMAAVTDQNVIEELLERDLVTDTVDQDLIENITEADPNADIIAKINIYEREVM